MLKLIIILSGLILLSGCNGCIVQGLERLPVEQEVGSSNLPAPAITITAPPVTTTATVISPAVTITSPPTTITQTVNQTIIRYLDTQPFPDLETLKEFISYWQANRVIVYESGKMDGACKWMAREIQREAARQGYDFPTETMTIAELSAVYHKTFSAYHRVNKAWIPGLGEWYYDDATEKLWQVW